jgi:hypothetical protein
MNCMVLALRRYAFSDDSGMSWTYAQENAYNGSVSWAEGGSTDLFRRERPHMVVDKRGAPLGVSNGVQECKDSGIRYAFPAAPVSPL